MGDKPTSRRTQLRQFCVLRRRQRAFVRLAQQVLVAAPLL